MLLKSIKLHNIRSYESAEVNFPSGSVLLAGDIGSGKSTILLAVEFAIFGAKKGELPAYTLLRHGKKEGSVELQMDVDGKEIIIKRILKKSNDDIRQDAGYVIVNGMKKDATSEELRAVVLEMLGYPKDLVRKGKDLIYRYTVYTPQEQMKQILYENKDTRLDTLRKVFNIDKYKRIRENAKIIISLLREKKKHLEGFTLDLEYKKRDLEERKKEILEYEKSIEELNPKIEDIKKIIASKKKSIQDIESEMKDMNSLKKELSVAEANLIQRIEQNNRLNEEIKKIDSQIEDISRHIGDKKTEDAGILANKITEKEKEIQDAENSHRNAIRKIREFEVKTEQSSDTTNKIRELDICPTCEQKVDDAHKQDIHLREGRKHEEFLLQIRKYRDEEAKLEKIRNELKKELETIMKEQNHLNILKMQIDNLSEKKGRREEKSLLKEKIKKEIGILNSKKLELTPKIELYSLSEEKYKAARRELDELLPQERFLELEKRKYETEKESSKRIIAVLEKEISEKMEARETLAYISQLSGWISEFFVELMQSIEKHVMGNIHSQFNSLFEEWFDMLMGDETINVKVDEEFTPIIEQNGYETYIENLSGGEKTSVALSYRLALNKVINDIVSGIKTKDIIMLDEPTDGFSSEQLDKVRDVLEQLNMKQAIIVSHESKIESFVQNVIRVQKQDHVSVVG